MPSPEHTSTKRRGAAPAVARQKLSRRFLPGLAAAPPPLGESAWLKGQLSPRLYHFRLRAKVDPWRGTVRFAEWGDWGTISAFGVGLPLLWHFAPDLRYPLLSGRWGWMDAVPLIAAIGLLLWVGRGLWRFFCLRRVDFSSGSDEVRLTVLSLAGVRRSVFPRSRVVLRKHRVRLTTYGSGRSIPWDGHALILYLDRQEAIALAVRQNEREVIDYRASLPEPIASLRCADGGHIDADAVRLVWW